jgi:glycosyltransferase involved in cell wall biosynthesis
LGIRIFYAAGPGGLVETHKYWRKGAADPRLTALTYSGQFADFCESVAASVYMVSHAGPSRDFSEGRFRVRQRPKPQLGGGGLGYHLAQVMYGAWLFLEALKFRADFAVIHSSSTHFFVLWIFRLAGIKVIPVLHNTLWPAGYPQAGPVRKFIRRLDGAFFRHCAHATLGVSPECLRQVQTLAGRIPPDRLIEMRGQFSRSYFDAIPAAPSQAKPFRMMFAGRVTESKGVFDLIDIARRVEDRVPGLVKWDVCGAGPDLEELRLRRDAMGLQPIVELHGHVLPSQMSEIIARNHAAIVPTKSSFEEGMALSAIEPVLANRPVITSSVVPACEVLGGACLKAEVDDVESYVAQVLRLAKSPEDYRLAANACAQVKEPFLDGKLGFAAALRRAFALN